MNLAPRTLGVWAGVLGLTGVAAGAFGAHGLEGRLDPDRLATFATGAEYHLIHALALGFAAWVAETWHRAWGLRAGVLFLAGVILFSGSLYVLAFTGVRWWGAVTPLGGVAFLAGWGCLALGARTRN